MIILIGTSHPIQIADLGLKSYLEGLWQKFNVRAVAEEMNQEALVENSCVASIPMQVASALRIPHRFCDPNMTQRAELNILQENGIRILIRRSKLPESEVAKRLEESYAKRERYWLEQLRDLNLWPVLFVCGADHVASFCKLLEQEIIVVHIAATDWTA